MYLTAGMKAVLMVKLERKREKEEDRERERGIHVSRVNAILESNLRCDREYQREIDILNINGKMEIF